MKKIISILITSVLLVHITPAVMAKSKGDWNAVKALAYCEVAVQTNTGETHYGQVRSVDDSGITVQIADHDDYTPQEVNFQRDEIAKVWRAELRFGERNIVKGAWLGAGVGFGVGLIGSAIQAGRGASDPPTGAGLYPIFGAGAGALAGTRWKKNHKKQELVYST